MMKYIVLSACFLSLLSPVPALAMVGGGDILFRVGSAGDVVYSHDFHVRQQRLGCTECHYRVFARMANNVKDKATMAQMAEGKSCGSCHNGKRAFGVDKNCGRCHHGGG